jgi:hypothetical protein
VTIQFWQDMSILVGGIELAGNGKSVTLRTEVAPLDVTALNTTGWVSLIGGLKSGSVTMSLHTDYATGSVNATLGPLLGSYGTVVASGTLGGVATSGTAVCLVTTLTPIGGAVGDLATQDVTWPTSGTVTGFGL